MKIVLRISSLVILLSASTYLQAQDFAPYIPDFGAIHDLENVVDPDPGKSYKIVIDLKTSQKNPKLINYGLNNVARMINLHGAGGVPLENLSVAVAIHGGATASVLSDESYQTRYGLENPNIAMMKQLRDAGVEIYVCGQSLKFKGFETDEVNEQTDVALSMLTVVSEKMTDGYSLLVFD